MNIYDILALGLIICLILYPHEKSIDVIEQDDLVEGVKLLLKLRGRLDEVIGAQEKLNNCLIQLKAHNKPELNTLIFQIEKLRDALVNMEIKGEKSYNNFKDNII